MMDRSAAPEQAAGSMTLLGGVFARGNMTEPDQLPSTHAGSLASA
jgi:hypothetical protein